MLSVYFWNPFTDWDFNLGPGYEYSILMYLITLSVLITAVCSCIAVLKIHRIQQNAQKNRSRKAYKSTDEDLIKPS